MTMLSIRKINCCLRVTSAYKVNTLINGTPLTTVVRNLHRNIVFTKNIAPIAAAYYKLVAKHQQRHQQYRCYASKCDSTNDLSNQQRIYYGTLTPRMKLVKLFSLTTSLAGIAAQPVMMEQGMKLGGAGMAVLLCSFAGFFTFVTPLLLHFITKKYVTEIYYNPSTEEYTATTISIFLYKIRTKFRPSDVKVPDVPGMFTTFFIGNKALFVDPSLFDDTEHYIRIMGYDKPIDFKLDLKDNTTPLTASTQETTSKQQLKK